MRTVFDPITGRNMPKVEAVARMIARGLGHNDETGMYWERYIAPAEIICREWPFVIRLDAPSSTKEARDD